MQARSSHRRRAHKYPGDGRARTGDPLLAKQVLSQLSYIPGWGAQTSTRRCGDGATAVFEACRRGRGPFWIRTRDLTVISRALSPTELKAHATRAGTIAGSVGPAQRARRSRSSTAEKWSDFRKSPRVGASSAPGSPNPGIFNRFALPAGRPSRWRAPSDPIELHPGTSSRPPRGAATTLCGSARPVAAGPELTGPRRDCKRIAIDGLCGPLPKRR